MQWFRITKPTNAGAPASQEAVDALYRITHAAPSKLSRAQAIRAQQRSAA